MDSSSEEDCFCLGADEDAVDSPLVFLGCHHKFHKICLRKWMRQKWSEGLVKKVDSCGRRLVRVSCPYCRSIISLDTLKILQMEKRLVCVNVSLEELPDSHDPDTTVEYAVYVNRGSGNEIMTSCQKFLEKNLPSEGSSSQQSQKLILFADFEIDTNYPAEMVEVIIQKVSPVFEEIKHFNYAASTLLSLEKDAFLEAQQQLEIDRLLNAGQLKIIPENQQQQEIEDDDEADLPNLRAILEDRNGSHAHGSGYSSEVWLPETPRPNRSFSSSSPMYAPASPPSSENFDDRSSSPPLPSISELIKSYIAPPPPPPPAAAETRDGPSRISPSSSFWSSIPAVNNNTGTSTTSTTGTNKRKHITAEESKKKKKMCLSRREKNTLKRIKSNIKNAERSIRILNDNIRRWETIRGEERRAHIETAFPTLSPSQCTSKIRILRSTINSLETIFDSDF